MLVVVLEPTEPEAVAVVVLPPEDRTLVAPVGLAL